MIIISIVFSLLFFIAPIAAVVWIVRLLVHRSRPNNKPVRGISFRDLLLASAISAAGFCGIVALYYVPLSIAGTTEDTSGSFVIRLVTGVVLMLFGLRLRGITGNFLMAIGILAFLLVAPYAFSNFGSAGTFLIICAAFIGLVVAALVHGKKEQVKA